MFREIVNPINPRARSYSLTYLDVTKEETIASLLYFRYLWLLLLLLSLQSMSFRKIPWQISPFEWSSNDEIIQKLNHVELNEREISIEEKMKRARLLSSYGVTGSTCQSLVNSWKSVVIAGWRGEISRAISAAFTRHDRSPRRFTNRRYSSEFGALITRCKHGFRYRLACIIDSWRPLEKTVMADRSSRLTGGGRKSDGGWS